MRLGIGLSEGTLALGEAERNIPECVPVTTLDGVNVPDGRNARNWERHMPREFTSEKALEHHTELTGDTYLMEGTATFAARQRLLSPGQYEIVDVRAGPGVRRAMLLPKGI
jgi:hypothetical protein